MRFHDDGVVEIKWILLWFFFKKLNKQSLSTNGRFDNSFLPDARMQIFAQKKKSQIVKKYRRNEKTEKNKNKTTLDVAGSPISIKRKLETRKHESKVVWIVRKDYLLLIVTIDDFMMLGRLSVTLVCSPVCEQEVGLIPYAFKRSNYFIYVLPVFAFLLSFFFLLNLFRRKK